MFQCQKTMHAICSRKIAHFHKNELVHPLLLAEEIIKDFLWRHVRAFLVTNGIDVEREVIYAANYISLAFGK